MLVITHYYIDFIKYLYCYLGKIIENISSGFFEKH